MYNPNVPSSNMGIEPVSSAPSQPLGPTPMGPPPPMMGGMPPPPMGAPMGPPPIAPITEGLGGFGGNRAGRAGFSERMQKMTAPPKPKPKPQQIQQPVQGMQYGGMVPRVPSFGQLTGRMPYLPQRGVSNSALSKSGGGIDQYGEYLEQTYGDPDFDQKRDDFLKNVSQQEQQTFGGGGGMGGRMGGIGSFAPHVMNQPFMGGALQQGFPSYGIHRQETFNPFGGRLKFFEDGGEVPRQAEISGQPHMLAYINPEEERLLRGLGGSGNPGPGGIPAYSYEDEAYEGDYGDVDYGGGGGGGGGNDNDGDDRDFDPPVPTPAPPVSPPSDDGDDGDDGDGGGGGGGGGRNVEQPVGPNNAQEALDQANADFKAGRGDIADLDLATLSSRISRGSDVMPASLSSIDAISRNFAVPAPTDTTFSDPDEIFDLSNPISLSAAQVVGPNPRTDASGNLVPGRSNTAADIEAGTLSARNLGPEVMSFDPASPGDMSNVNVGQSPVISGMADRPVVGTNFPPAGSRPPSYSMPSALNATPPAPKMALPGGSARQGILGPKEDVNLENAMAAAKAVDSGTLPADQQAAATGYRTTSIAEAMDAPAGDINPFIGITDVEAAANDAVIPQNTKNLSIFDISELENAARDYRETGAGSKGYSDMSGSTYATAEALKRAEDDVSALDRIAEARMPTDDMQIVDDIQNPPKTLRQATGRAPMTSEEAILNMSGIDSAGNVVSLAGKSGYDSPEAAANRANALAQTVPAATDTAGGTAPKANFDFKYPNTGKTREVFIDPTDSKVYFDDRFDKTSPMSKAFSQLVSSLSYGLIDLDKISAKQREKGLEAYQKTQKLAYDDSGRVVGVKDPEGRTILLGPQPQNYNETDGDDGCSPGFRRVNGVCQPIDGVSANPADDIADDIEKATMPIIRPLDPPTGDVPTVPVADDPSGIDFRRPNYFAGGGAVSDGMGSAIDNFISAMSR